jgi:hypothetical protein
MEAKMGKKYLLVLAVVSACVFAGGGCASFTADATGHRFHGVTRTPGQDMVSASVAEVNSAQAYAIRSQADVIDRAAERGDIIPVPGYGYGGYGGGMNAFDAEFYGVSGVAVPGYRYGTPVQSPGNSQIERRVDAMEQEVASHRHVLRGIERVMRREAVNSEDEEEGGE